SPATLTADSPPPVYVIDDEDAGPTVIDLETSDELPALNESDFPTNQTSQAANHESMASFNANGRRYKMGQTVELGDGDLMRIAAILQDKRTKEIHIRGPRFRRASRFRGLFDQHLNELVMLIEHNEPRLLYEEPQMQTDADFVPSRDVIRLREMILTNEAYPAYSFKESRQSKWRSRAEAREQGRLVCRWKLTMIYRMKATRKACVQMSIEKLRADASDHNYRAKDEYLREEFRGETIKGGSSPAWLKGEEYFDRSRQKLNQGIDILHRRKFCTPHTNKVDLTTYVPQGEPTQRYTFGDAFCGTGGASSGAKSAGFRIDWGFDFDPAAIESYKQNFFATRCEAMPAHIFVTCIKENHIVDVIHLSPPCKTFSPAHTREGQNDEMNSSSFFAVEELLKKTKPRIVTLENTFGLVERWRDWLNCMVRFFTALGFSVRWKVFNLAEYGLPQARRRLIVFASCSPGEKLPDFPEPTHGPGLLPLATINDAIARIPRGFANHDVQGAIQRNAAPYDGALPLRNCVTTGGTLDIHPCGRRSFTDRELACLQGFGLEHIFGPTGVKKQIGNAFPPFVALIFFSHIRRQLEEADRTTRTAAHISSEDLAFHRSINPEVDRLLEEQNRRLLAIVRDLNRSATAGTDTVPPPLENVESIDDGWRSIVDVIDNLLEKADACLDEYTGVIKKLSPAHRHEAAVADAKRPLARHEYRNQNILKPQRLFRRIPINDEANPFKPLLTSKPNARVPLDESLTTTPQLDGSIQYKHPYEPEILASTYPEKTYVPSTPIPFLPFEATSATWVDTPEGVQAMLRDLKEATEIAVDVEHHDMHSYVGLVSLLQISTRDKDWIVDTLLPWREDLQVLNEVFTDPRIIKVLHGSTSDIVWLQRDLGLYIVGLFDTYHASRLLGYPKHSLAYLLHRHAAYEADKRYQMADWRMRPLPKQMYDYARSDTHFLLYIFDNIRNELLAKTNAANAAGNLVDEVCMLSKAEALQRYERYFYDAKTGTGVTGWHGMLLRSPDRLDRQQLAVLRAVHEWRDKVAREEDESLQQILTNRAIFVIAREMPTEVPRLLSYCKPSHISTKKRVAELLDSITRAKAEGVNGPELEDLIIPRARPNDSAPLHSITTNPAKKPVPSPSRRSKILGSTSANGPAILNASQFWGATVKRDTQYVQRNQSIRTSKPDLVLPLPPLTAQIFETKTTDEPPAPTPASMDPGARVAHQFTKKRKPQEEDVFVVKQSGSKKRKTTQAQEGPALAEINKMGPLEDRAADRNARQDEAASLEEQGNEGGLTKSQRRQQRKRKLREERQASNGDGAGKAENGDTEAFDYEDPAHSVLHTRKGNGAGGAVKRGIDPYSKSLDAPKGMRKVHREVPGRSMTYKS
ncbi:MAG: hypothetical protein LQ345_001929, partial [Seirophora villosa]